MNRKTIKNKIVAISLLAIGIITAFLTTDMLVLIFASCICGPLFFAKENWID